MLTLETKTRINSGKQRLKKVIWRCNRILDEWAGSCDQDRLYIPAVHAQFVRHPCFGHLEDPYGHPIPDTCSWDPTGECRAYGLEVDASKLEKAVAESERLLRQYRA